MMKPSVVVKGLACVGGWLITPGAGRALDRAHRDRLAAGLPLTATTRLDPEVVGRTNAAWSACPATMPHPSAAAYA